MRKAPEQPQKFLVLYLDDHAGEETFFYANGVEEVNRRINALIKDGDIILEEVDRIKIFNITHLKPGKVKAETKVTVEF